MKRIFYRSNGEMYVDYKAIIAIAGEMGLDESEIGEISLFRDQVKVKREKPFHRFVPVN